MYLDPRNGDRFDLPPWTGPTRSYVVASLPRTGSTMLCRLLEATVRVGAPKEYLNPMQLRDWGARLAPWAVQRMFYARLHGGLVNLCGRGWWTEAALDRYLDAIRARRTGPTGWFGIKLHHHHFQRWFLDRGWPVGPHLRADAWVLITRRDRIAQAISWARALQTGRWAAQQTDAIRPIYSRALIDRYVRKVEEGEAGWRAWFASQGIVPHEVVYEDLVADPERVIRGVLQFLDVPHADEVNVPPPPTRRQSDPESEAWRLRYALDSTDGEGP